MGMSDDNKPPTETLAERERLLKELHPRERKIVEDVMAQHKELTAAEAIEACRSGGM
jgi:hypothetical protein